MGRARRSVVLAVVLLVPPLASAADWPQWREPDRTNVSAETGLLSAWPAAGPPLAWKATGIGDGVVPVAVAGGRVYLTGYRDGSEYLLALAETDGKKVWEARLGPTPKEFVNMRWLNQRTPLVDGDRVYVATVLGDWVCVRAADGLDVWRRNAAADFGGKPHAFGFCDYPLIDGDRLIVTPGGKTAMAAVDKRTGKTIWACPLPTPESSAHAAVVVAEVGGVRQYVNHLSGTMVGVAAADGKLLWQYAGMKARIAVTYCPMVRDDTVFYATGYAAGHVLLKLTKSDGGFTATEVYRDPKATYASWLGSLTEFGGHIYASTLNGFRCIERPTGRTVWEEKTGRVTYTVADNRVYLYSLTGTLTLAGIDPSGFRKVSEFRPFDELGSRYGVAFPVVANGRLYVRDLDKLHVYDIRDPARPAKVPDAVYVPSPPEVVDKLLGLARVAPADVVYDLGSGDGRVVIAAAKRGCRAVGVEIDPSLVADARRSAAEAGVGGRARYDGGDLLAADFSAADVVAVYLPPDLLARLVPKFQMLKPGSRVVAHEAQIPGFVPDATAFVTSAEDEVRRTVYLYTVPLRAK